MYIGNIYFHIYMSTYENLIYPTLDSYDTIQNILLIDQSVIQSQVFYDNANLTSYPIVYNSLTKREDLSQLLSRFIHLDRIAFVFHGIYPGCYYDKPFLEEQPLFTLDGSGTVIDSENVSFVQSLITTLTVSHVDFLGCNLLLSEEWLKYFDILRANSDCVVGASNDQTGNLKYGGDWILENTMEDVRETYFTIQIEDLTTTLLTSSITRSITILQTDITGFFSWPVTISGTNITVTFGSNLRLTTTSQYFIIANSGVTIDGSNYIVTFSSVAGYSGLIQNGTSGANGYSNTTVQNITVTSTGTTTLANLGGYLCRPYFGKGAGIVNNLINNCNNTGVIISSVATGQCGGLIGAYCAYTGGVLTVNNCSNSGSIGTPSTTTYMLGGLFGIRAAGGPTTTSVLSGGTLYVNNCSNTGYIYTKNSGGLFTEQAAYNGTIYINNCFNSGTIDDKDNTTGNAGSNGGIFGIQAGVWYGRIYMTNCYNTGTIKALQAGGLFGSLSFFYGGTGIITNSYNLGDVSGTNAGGLVGSTPLFTDASTSAGYLTITNSYSIGSYLGTNVGGLVGGSGALAIGTVSYAGTLTVTNCYCVGSATITSPTNNVATKTFSNNYTIASSWSDTAASAALLNTPTSLYVPGSVWASPAVNTPYIFPSGVITSNTTFTASDGFLKSDTGAIYPWSGQLIPITGNNITVKFGGNFNLTTIKQYFQINGSNVTVDGSNNTVTVNNFASFPGLFNITSSLSNITLQNIKIVGNSAQPISGILVGPTTTIYPNGFNVFNCSITGTATLTLYCGVFCGINSTTGPTFGNTTFQNCFNSLPVGSQNYQSGFFSYGQQVRSNCIFDMTNCFNSGTIGSGYASGLMNSSVLINTNALVNLTNCFNSGNIIGGSYHSGLIGTGLQGTSCSLNLTNCYNMGSSTGISFISGLIGQNSYTSSSSNFTININKCYNTCNLGSATNSAAFIITDSNPGSMCYLNISNCYSTSTGSFIQGTQTNITVTSTNTFNTNGGSWTDSAANGALTGTPTSVSSPGTVWASVVANTPYIFPSGVITSNTTFTASDGFLKSDTGAIFQWSDNGPIPIAGNDITVKFGGNFNLTTTKQYFQINGSNITVDGSTNTVTVNNFASFPGLFNITSSLSNITLQNIKIVGNSAQPISGILVGPNTTIYPDGFNVLNCSITGTATLTLYCGVFCGINSTTGPTFGNTTFQNCFNSLPIGSQNYQSGFFSYGQQVRSNCIFDMTNCFNTGNIGSGVACSGLIGARFTINTNVIVNLTNCFNTGNCIGGSYHSGLINSEIICNGNLNLLNCYNVGSFLSGTNHCGLISGFLNSSTNGNIKLTNCYNRGTMAVTTNAALVYQFSSMASGTNCKLSINNCYSTAAAVLVYGTLTNITVTSTNTYNTNGGSWADSLANSSLTGTPISTSSPGTVWGSAIVNTPYLFTSGVITSNTIFTDLNGFLKSDADTIFPWSVNGPIPIVGNNITVKIGGNLTLSRTTQYFQINSSNVIVDGGNNIVSLSATNYPGLFASIGFGNITIQNIIINLLSTATHGGGGKQAWLTSYQFASGQSNILISNCGITGTPNATSTYGGLLTSDAQCTLIGCYNTSDDCSVVCASSATPTYRRVINCWNSGSVTGQSGGIIGTNSTATYISGCYNKGSILSGGGILPGGAMSGFQGNATVINCYNTGSINAGGGITGANFGIGTGSGTTTNIINVQNCYNVGTVNGGAYGLIGGFAGSLKTINISNCYNYSSQLAINTGGSTSITLNTTNVYSSNIWSDSAANATGNLINTPSSVFSHGTVWTSIAANTPYLLSSITGNLYSPNIASTQLNTYTTATIYGNNFSLLSVNSANPDTYATINATSGIISFFNLIEGSYNARVMSYLIRNNQYSNYEFTTFQLVVSLPPPLYPANTYNHTFYTYSNANPTVLTRTVYNDAGVQQSTTNITFGGQTIQAALSALDSESSSFTIGVKDTSNNKISMDLAFFGAYSSVLTQTQQNAMISYVNTNYKEPHTSATTYVVTVSNNVFYLNGSARPNITFVSGNLYVFDQSNPTNIGNLLVLGTTVDVSSSVVGNKVVYNGTPGSVNAYTLIDFSGSNPAPLNVYYFSSTNTGMGSV